jgi:hypothetical protein
MVKMGWETIPCSGKEEELKCVKPPFILPKVSNNSELRLNKAATTLA